MQDEQQKNERRNYDLCKYSLDLAYGLSPQSMTPPSATIAEFVKIEPWDAARLVKEAEIIYQYLNFLEPAKPH